MQTYGIWRCCNCCALCTLVKVFLSAEHIRQVGLPSACARAQVALRHARYAICTFTLTAFKDAAVARVLLFYLQALLFPLRLCTVGTCTVVHWLRKKNGGGGGMEKQSSTKMILLRSTDLFPMPNFSDGPLLTMANVKRLLWGGVAFERGFTAFGRMKKILPVSYACLKD